MHAPSDPVQSLEALQARMAEALLAPDASAQAMPESLFAGAHDGAVGLRVHRNTVLGALANALRQSFVAVDRLVGEAFFDRMAVEFARARPPRAPQLDEYGAGFPDFIAAFPGTEALPYLKELAQFEWQFAALARCRVAAESAAPSLRLDNGLRLLFAAPLWLHASRFPVEALRAAILADDAGALQAIDIVPGAFHWALWRSEQGVHVRALGPASARFLAAVFDGADVAAALAAAEGSPPGGQAAEIVAQALAQEIMPAGFVRIEKAEGGA